MSEDKKDRRINECYTAQQMQYIFLWEKSCVGFPRSYFGVFYEL